jgi:DNA ligase (NAD+)
MPRAQAVEGLRHLVTRRHDIEGLGAENIDLLFNAGLIKTAADIFTLRDRRPPSPRRRRAAESKPGARDRLRQGAQGVPVSGT